MSSPSHPQVLSPITNISKISNRHTTLNSNILQSRSNKLASVHIPYSQPATTHQASPVDSLSPFEKIKLETDRTIAHGHPLILPTEYGRHGPVFDVIALYHNAVKRQAIVAYNILEVLNRFKYEVTPAETEMFFVWFNIFKDAVTTILRLEQKHVFPFLEQNGVAIPHLLNTAERQNARNQISATLNSIEANLETIRLLAAGESIRRISSLVHAFLNVITDYLEIQRSSLPNAITAATISAENEVHFCSTFIRDLFVQNNASTCVPFLCHWLSQRQLGIWKKTHLGLFRTLRHDQWRRKFSSSYQEIPIAILTRLTSATASAKRTTPTSYQGRKNRYKFR